jgi:hypothetical protein
MAIFALRHATNLKCDAILKKYFIFELRDHGTRCINS